MSPKKFHASFRMSHGHLLELTSIKEEEFDADKDEDVMILRKELRIRLTAFQSYSCITPYIQVFLRLIILCFSAFILSKIFKEFFLIINRHSADQKSYFDTNNVAMKFFIRFLMTSIKSERTLMLIFLMSVVPLYLVCYGYFVAFLGSLYGATNPDVFDEILDSEKSFWTKRLESCSLRLDSVLGYASTVPLLDFLILFNFKTIPILPISYGLMLLVLIFIDEMLMIKRIFEVDSIFNSVQLDLFISGIGISWIFFVRFMEPKLHTSPLSDELGTVIFLSIILIVAHCSGCVLKYLIRRVKAKNTEKCNKINGV